MWSLQEPKNESVSGAGVVKVGRIDELIDSTTAIKKAVRRVDGTVENFLKKQKSSTHQSGGYRGVRRLTCAATVWKIVLTL